MTKENIDKTPFDVKFVKSLKKGKFIKYVHNNLQFKLGKTPSRKSKKTQIFKFQHTVNDKDFHDIEFITEYVTTAIFKKLKEQIDIGHVTKALFFKNPDNDEWITQDQFKAYALANELTEEEIKETEHELQVVNKMDYNCNFKLNQKHLDNLDCNLFMEELTEVKCGSLIFYYACDRVIKHSKIMKVDENDNFTGEVERVEKVPTSNYDLRVYLPMKARASLKNANL